MHEYNRCKYNIIIQYTQTVCVCSKVDPGNTGKVGPTEAALFLKKSGLPDITLGKVGCGKSHTVFCVLADGVNVTSHRAGEVW